MKMCLLLLPGLMALAVALSPPYFPPTSPPGPPQVRPSCSIGLWMYDGCNTCRCTRDRHIKCTKYVCPPPLAYCQYGRTYLDQCANICLCQKNGEYKCQARGTPGGGVCYGLAQVGKPVTCAKEGEIHVVSHTRFFCKSGIVHYEHVEDENRCAEGASWKVECNTCHCSGAARGCTRMGCISHAEEPRRERPAPLLFGDVLVPEDEPCPAYLREAPGQLGVKVCQAEGCTPGAEWQLSDCVKCVCTRDGQPACTPCARKATNSSVLCNGNRQCPADCGRSFSPEKDCYECKCGVSEPGDVTAQFGQRCPRGFDHRANDAFFKVCGPIDQLPIGDTSECSKEKCDDHCIFVRRSDNGCVFCQCKGNVLVPTDQECPSPTVEVVDGNRLQYQKLCKAPTREECSAAGTEYNVDCDTCICQDNGFPACTEKKCNLPITAGCPHGQHFIDECTNMCHCTGIGYGCTKKGCPPGTNSGKPLTCTSPKGLPKVKGRRVFCHQGIVQFQPLGAPCVPDSTFLDEKHCNECTCGRNHAAACTKKFCLDQAQLPHPSPNTGY